ncbi:MAG: DNA repair protein RadC [Proteobacteria bacterium]|nr:DNA repair protein RadC [Pseudomonadota bacterium]
MNKKTPNLSEGHRQRLRKKFLDSGLTGFHDYEIIELLLTLGTPRKDCKASAKALLDRFKTFHGVIDASPSELVEVKGVGPTNIFGLKFVKAVSEKYLENRIIGRDPIKNSKDLLNYLYLNIKDKGREAFRAIYLDAKNRVISSEILFEGTLTSSAVYPREVIKAALQHKAASMIFAHNHPSGDPAPSPEDYAITRQLVFSCHLMGVVVHEHIIIGSDSYYSFADQGLIRQYTSECKAENE